MKIAVAIHNHQPVGNFDSVFEDATARAYRPFLDSLKRHPGVRLSMHWSGSLLEWLEAHDARLIDALGELVARGQVELLSGAFYEPILAVIPSWDQQGQLQRMAEYLRARFGVTPRGAWLAERVWEPSLPDVLADAGIQYTLLDDHHFLLAGADPAALREPYGVESNRRRIGVFPIDRELRYRIPFQAVPELLDYLGGDAAGGTRVFGDDGEKFGIWPHTHDWVYGQGWLEAWLTALEERRGVECLPVGEAWDEAPPQRVIALPAASYPEMMLWALPAEQQARVEREQEWLEREGKADLARRIATGTWREFFARYPESRRLHRRVAEVSEKANRAAGGDEARREIHRAECNCSYWHGVFGGFYLPHLRNAVRAHMLRADRLLDPRLPGEDPWRVENSYEEDRLQSDKVSLAIARDTGALVEIASRLRPYDFAQVIARRREAYHLRVEEAARKAAASQGAQHEAHQGGAPETIHGAISLKERGLEQLLEYDERPRHASQEWILPEADRARAGSLRRAIGTGPVGLHYRLAGPLILESREGPRKTIASGPDDRTFEVRFEGAPADHWLVSEWNLTLLTPEAPGRRLVIEGAQARTAPPGSTGESEGVTSMRLEDTEHLGVALTLRFTPAARMEWHPVETVSLSEAGAERVYQGTAFLFGFPIAGSGSPIRILARLEETGDVL